MPASTWPSAPAQLPAAFSHIASALSGTRSRPGREMEAGQGDMLLAGMKIPVLEAAGRDRPGEGDLHSEDVRELKVLHRRRVYLVEVADHLF